MNILSKLSEREKIIACALTAVVTLSVIYIFLIEPFFNRWNNINREIKLTKAKLLNSLSLIKEKPKIDKEYASYFDRFKAKASDEEEITSILNDLETFARSSNAKITGMRPKPVKDMEYYKRFIVEVETESDMSSLMKFIYDIKTSPRLLKVERLNINTRSSQEGVIIRASLVISKVAVR